MSKIDRAEALRRVNDYYDKLEAVVGVNDPDRDAKARDAAWDAFTGVREIGAPLVAERLGAARLANREYRAEIPWGEKAREAAAKPFAKGSMGMDQHEAACCRAKSRSRAICWTISPAPTLTLNWSTISPALFTP